MKPEDLTKFLKFLQQHKNITLPDYLTMLPKQSQHTIIQSYLELSEEARDALDRNDYGQLALFLPEFAQAGNYLARIVLGMIYTTGGHGLEQDKEEARKWLEPLIPSSDGQAELYMGGLCDRWAPHVTVIYKDKFKQRGDYLAIEADPECAETWYRKSRALGNPEAAYRLAFLIMHERSLMSQPEKAAEVHAFYEARQKTPAYADDPETNANLGLLYFYGIGTERNAAKALQHFNTASAHQDANSNALIHMSVIYQEGFHIPRNQERASELLRRAKAMGISSQKITERITSIREYMFQANVIEDKALGEQDNDN